MMLTVEQGCFSYSRDKKNEAHPLLNNINFTAQSGEMIAILGSNGAGKTTLLKCLMGLLKWTSGKSTLDGKDIRTIPASRLWQTIAYVPQAKNTVISYSVEEMILLGRCSHLNFLQRPGIHDLKMMDDVMKQLHIEYLAGKRCNEISGGELQMVLIAKALLSQPKIMILDEPESNLDYRNQIIILDTMSQLTLAGMTCIFNTHYPAHALQRATKALLLLKDGSYQFGNVTQVITEKNLVKAFGVKTVIGEIETPARMIRDIIPLAVHMPKESAQDTDTTRNLLAVISIIMNCDTLAQSVNQILYDYQSYIVGRMGMPYRSHQIYIINITIDAPKAVTDTLTQQLMLLPAISVKTTYEQLPESYERSKP